MGTRMIIAALFIFLGVALIIFALISTTAIYLIRRAQESVVEKEISEWGMFKDVRRKNKEREEMKQLLYKAHIEETDRYWTNARINAEFYELQKKMHEELLNKKDSE